MIQVLIADDEEIIRNGLKTLIESSDLNLSVCSVATDGEDVIKQLIKYRPEIVLMDINMPLLNGLESIEKIREIDKNVKIIIISGYCEFEYAQKALELDVFSYLLKPINYMKLFETLNKASANYILNSNNKNLYLIPTDSYTSSALDAINYINDNFTNNDLTLTFLAQKFHISQSYLAKIIKVKTGVTFSDYLNNLRVQHSIKLLRTQNYTVAKISELVGYSSQHYFSRVFKNVIGISPNKFK